MINRHPAPTPDAPVRRLRSALARRAAQSAPAARGSRQCVGVSKAGSPAGRDGLTAADEPL